MHPFPGTLPNLRQLGLYIGHLYLRHEAPQEARTPPDERDSAIMRRSISSAYYVLIVGMILVGCVMPFVRADGPSSMPRFS
jgi:hypothetical protein